MKQELLKYLESGNLVETVQKLTNAYQFAVENIDILKTRSEEEKLTAARCITVGVLAVSEIIVTGKKPEDFTEEDWKSIAERISEDAIKVDGRAYSAYVFDMYAGGIEKSIKANEEILSEKARMSLEGIVEDMRTSAEELENGQISEVAFIEKNLWLSLEGMLKLVSATKTRCLGVEYSALAQAVTQFGFELGRYKLYKQEQQYLEEYLKNQMVLDEELEEKYRNYEEELENYSEYFNDLIDNAFDCDFREGLTGSIALARKLGVKEQEILKSLEDVDDFFMG